MYELKKKENLNPTDNADLREKLLEQFVCKNTLLIESEKQAAEDILVEYHDAFARHRLDIGINTEFRVIFTPNYVYTRNLNLAMPFHLKEDLSVELALMHKYGNITRIFFSKYTNFAQRKPDGKQKLFVDLRKNNTMIGDNNTNNNHPVSTLSDAGQTTLGKEFFSASWIAPMYHKSR